MTQEQIMKLKNELQISRFKLRIEDDKTIFSKEIIDDEMYGILIFHTDNTVKVFVTSIQTGSTYGSDFVFREQDSIKINIVKNITHLFGSMLCDILFEEEVRENIKRGIFANS